MLLRYFVDTNFKRKRRNCTDSKFRVMCRVRKVKEGRKRRRERKKKGKQQRFEFWDDTKRKRKKKGTDEEGENESRVRASGWKLSYVSCVLAFMFVTCPPCFLRLLILPCDVSESIVERRLCSGQDRRQVSTCDVGKSVTFLLFALLSPKKNIMNLFFFMGE